MNSLLMTLLLVVTPLAPNTGGEPSGPCNVAPSTAESFKACRECIQPLYPPPNLPPLTPHQAAVIGWNCGMPGANNPADVPLDQNGQ